MRLFKVGVLVSTFVLGSWQMEDLKATALSLEAQHQQISRQAATKSWNIRSSEKRRATTSTMSNHPESPPGGRLEGTQREETSSLPVDFPRVKSMKGRPTHRPTRRTTRKPARSPTGKPTKKMMMMLLTHKPVGSHQKSAVPSEYPSGSSYPSVTPSNVPSQGPSSQPSMEPTTTYIPSQRPSVLPSLRPSLRPSRSQHPSQLPSLIPSLQPSQHPSSSPSQQPSINPFCAALPRYTGTGHRYKVINTTVSWSTAKTSASTLFPPCCGGRRAHLATITNADENAFVHNLYSEASMWLGLSDSSKEGDFRWVVAGEVYNSSNANWASGYPSGPGDPLKDCVYMRWDGTWSDTPCAAKVRYVIEYDCR